MSRHVLSHRLRVRVMVRPCRPCRMQQNAAHGPTLALFHTLQIWQYAGRWSSFEPASRHVLMKIK